MPRLVPGRTCGLCNACCRALPIDAPELRKSSGVLCRHCTPGLGCTIHDDAPRVCRDFFCAWRELPRLDDTWRPDRSGLILVFDDADIPDAYPQRPGVKFVLTGRFEAMLTRSALEYLAGLVAAGAPAFLSVPGPAGFHFVKAFLNARLRDPVARRDGSAIVEALSAIHAELARGPFEPVVFAAPAIMGR